jgi:SPP1 family predicted phage head-tail adaptor
MPTQQKPQVVDVGSLNSRVQIQQQTTAQDDYGAEQQVWSTVYTCWASITVERGQLLYQTAEFISKAAHRITMRWTSSVVIRPNMRIVYTEPTTGVVHTYNVEALLNTDQRNRILVILAYELNGGE